MYLKEHFYLTPEELLFNVQVPLSLYYIFKFHKLMFAHLLPALNSFFKQV